MIPIADALDRLACIQPLPTQLVTLGNAYGARLAAHVTSTTDLPPFNQSAMDGYAVNSADLANATAGAPVTLVVAAVIAAGPQSSRPTLHPHTACRIFTGAPVPAGADAVVMQEHVHVEVGGTNNATFSAPIDAGTNVRDRAEEVKRGATIAEADTVLRSGHIAAISMAGVATVEVFRKPIVRVFVTGDEVVQPGQPLRLGQVYDANAAFLRAFFAERGIDVQPESLPDDLEATTAALNAAAVDADLIVTSGGVSVGDRDFVIPAAEACGMERLFWKVAQKPGKPLYAAIRDSAAKSAPHDQASSKPTADPEHRCLLLGLPGNPAAVHAGAHIFVNAALRCLGGQQPHPDFQWAELGKAVKRNPKRSQWVRVRSVMRDGKLVLDPLTGQASHTISNLIQCTGLALVEPGNGPLDVGSRVPWIPVAG